MEEAMLKVKVTKNIMGRPNNQFNLSFKQIIVGVIGIAAGFSVLYFGWGKIQLDLLMTLVFITIFAVIMFGVVKVNGMSLAKFLLLGLKGVDKRPYCTKGGFSDD
jgi:uncharacterized membrane protein YccC